MKKVLFWIGLIALVAVLASSVGYWFTVNYLAKQDPDMVFNENAIREILKGEARAYYADGSTLLGSYFDVNHRLYVQYDSIPTHLINGLIAGEDQNFFSHGGFDIKGITRAMVHNIKNGKVTQGGSTLTQQTAKNIFGREERTLKAKIKELLAALRLEYFFGKQKILEFYLNQFYVSGTGRGVGIAAWYFFSKDLSQLSLKECAFIAGSVKGPSTYDVFIRKTKEQKQKAYQRAMIRTGYILDRMYEEGYINEQKYHSAMNDSLQFTKGAIRFHFSSPLERIQEALDTPHWKYILDSLQISDWRKAQLRIISTLHPSYQFSASSAVKQNLSHLQRELDSYIAPQAKYAEKITHAPAGTFVHAQIDSIIVDTTSQSSALVLKAGSTQLLVDNQELLGFSQSLNPGHKDSKSILQKRVDSLLASKGWQKGGILLVRLLQDTKPGSPARVQIESRSELQGALMVLDSGKVQAAMNGFDNKDFDRVNHALRQFGSSWKPPLYALAISLGWHMNDTLENQYNLFMHGNTLYIPNPDHLKRDEQVSILTAGVRSENIASIWLLVHLLNKLPQHELKQLAQQLGHLPRATEDFTAFQARLRDSLGLYITNATRQQIEFYRAKNTLLQQYKQSGQSAKYRGLQALPYRVPKLNAPNIRKLARSGNTALVQYSFVHLDQKYPYTQNQSTIDSHNNPTQPTQPSKSKESRDTSSAFRLPSFGAGAPQAKDSSTKNTTSDTLLAGFTTADFNSLQALLQPAQVHNSYLEFQDIQHWEDWRISLAMHAFAHFLQQAGVQNPLQTVLSMPLGSNDVTLSEIATVYQSILTGLQYRLPHGEWNKPIWIQEIQDFEGRSLYKTQVESKSFLPRSVTIQVAHILEQVIINGTGRRAQPFLKISQPAGSLQLQFPAMGKTGTTNNYKNAAFVGGIPRYNHSLKGFDHAQSLIVASYVGYDDNTPMISKHKRLRLSGASGALPPWAICTQHMLSQLQVQSQIDFLDLEYLLNPHIQLAE